MTGGGVEMPRWRFPVEETESGALMVRGDVSDYVIEPIRFDLGFSRVEMVDDHLKGRSDKVWRDSADTDALLAARSQFEEVEETVGPPFMALFHGACERCEHPIRYGQLIFVRRADGAGYVHERCPR